jgi:hypothetical protein
MSYAYVPDPASYASLRQVLIPDLAIAAAETIRARMEAEFGEGAADAYDAQIESLFGDIGRSFSSAVRDVGHFAARAAPVVANVGGGALQGALAGSALGLPGIIAGAAAGGTGAALSQYGGGTARQIGGALTGLTGLAGQFSPLGRVGASLGPAISGLAGGGSGGPLGAASGLLNGVLGAATGGGGAAGGVAQALSGLLGGRGGAGAGGLAQALGGLLGGQGGVGAGGVGQVLGGLLQSPAASQALAGLFGGGSAATQIASFLRRPEAQQAFAALQLGRLGRPTVPVGSAGTLVPTAAFPQLLSQLADQVVAEAAGWAGESEGALEYMQDAEGEYVGDPALDRDRSARVWNLLNEAQAERVLDELAEAVRPPPRRFAPRAAVDVDAEWYDAMDRIELASLEGEAAWDWESDYADA